jgi:hypothetical protein
MPTGTYSTERAIACHKLYLFSEKGFSAFVGPPDSFRYLQEPALLHLILCSSSLEIDQNGGGLPKPKG